MQVFCTPRPSRYHSERSPQHVNIDGDRARQARREADRLGVPVHQRAAFIAVFMADGALLRPGRKPKPGSRNR